MSDNKKLVLENVSVNTSGVYRCEVSADAPAFTTVQGEARMEVVCKLSQLSRQNKIEIVRKVCLIRVSDGN